MRQKVVIFSKKNEPKTHHKNELLRDAKHFTLPSSLSMAPKRQKMKTTAKTLRGEDDTVDVYDFDAQITSATIQTTEKEEEEEETAK